MNGMTEQDKDQLRRHVSRSAARGVEALHALTAEGVERSIVEAMNELQEAFWLVQKYRSDGDTRPMAPQEVE